MSIEKDLAEQVIKMKAAPDKKWVAAIIICVILVALAAWFGWQHYSQTEAKLRQATILTEQQAKDINVLQNELKISQGNAAALQAAIAEAKSGQRQPEVKFVVQAPTVQAATSDVADRIKNKDKQLPPAALGDSDRNAVIPQQVKQPDGSLEWQVGVYKINTYRNWEWSIGYGRHDGDSYMPVELQRNYSKNQAVAAEVHMKETGKVAGWEVKYVIKTDKLFLLF